MTLASESSLGPYIVHSLLGIGGMGEVYRAKDTRLNRDVAIKVISSKNAGSETRSRFLHEARAVSALNHPNIITIHDVGESDGISYIVMELVEGQLLREFVQSSAPLPVRKALDIGIQIADGLAAAHGAGIVHRDLKPENIMLSRDGRVKILDFGLAKSVDGIGAEINASLGADVTAPGIMLGTAPYMSPEQARGNSVSFYTDQFALGVILYEMATGISPFKRPTGLQTLSAILTEDAPLLTVGSVPFQWLVKRCLHKEPDHRYASTTDLLRELQNIRVHMTETAEPQPAPVLEPEPGREHRVTTGRAWIRPFWISVAVLMTAAIAFLAGRGLRASVWSQSQRSLYVPFETGGGLEVFPAWSPNGRTIAFSADRDGIFQIFTRTKGAPSAAELTHSDKDCLFPFWSPDGVRLYFISAFEGEPALWAIGATGGSPELILTNVAKASVAGETLAAIRRDDGAVTYSLWIGSIRDRKLRRYDRKPFADQPFLPTSHLHFSPGGNSIGIWRSLTDGRSEFWILPLTEGEPRRVLRQLEAFPLAREFAWMGGSTVVFSNLSGLSINTHLYLADLDQNTIEPLSAGPGSEFSPSAAPNGQTTAFSSATLDYDLVSIPLAGGPVRELGAGPALETSPTTSPAGQFAYVTDRTGEPEIWLRSSKESWDRPLVTASAFGEDRTGYLLDAVFSPDGSRLAYRRAGSDDEAIWISPATGDPPVRLAKEPGDALQAGPTWSPDGNFIAYFSIKKGNYVLMRARVGALEPPVQIADKAGVYPAWSPDGRWISVISPQGGLALIAADGTERRAIGRGVWLVHGWSRDGRTIYGIKQTPDRRLALVALGPSGGNESTLSDLGPYEAAYSYGVAVGAPPFRGFALSPDGSSFLTSTFRARSDIWLLQRTP